MLNFKVSRPSELDKCSLTHESDKGAPILLLHGFLSDMSSLDQIASLLSKQYTVVQVDLPGFGQSVEENHLHYESIDEIAHALDDIRKHLSIEQWIVFGYSMGGRVALSYAMNDDNRSIKGLILESSHAGIQDNYNRLERQKIDEERGRNAIEKGIESFVADWESLPLFQSQYENCSVDQLEQQRHNRLAQGVTGLNYALVHYGSGVMPSYMDRLNMLDYPVVLINGSLDKKFVQIHERMAHYLKYCTVHTVENVGHSIHMECREKFDTILLDSIKAISQWKIT